MKGLIVKALSGFYYVKVDNNIFECRARGKFRNVGESPLVGDYVEVSVADSSGTVDYIYDRKNFLQRPPIANIDKLFIISSAVTPSPNLTLIDKMTALCESKNIEPIIIFNKSDLQSLAGYVEKYKNVGYKAIECSAANNTGIEEIIEELKGSISAFTGNSGVGKSSILNIIFPNLNLSTGNVSSKLGRGKHTTRHTELFAHGFNGYVADTPGFSSIEYTPEDINFKDNLDSYFPEFSDIKSNCKFSDCKHIGEKGCAVCAAAKDGIIDADRLSSYQSIYNELKDFKPWDVKKTEGK